MRFKKRVCDRCGITFVTENINRGKICPKCNRRNWKSNSHRKNKDLKRINPFNNMEKLRPIKRYSNVNVIKLTPTDMIDNNLNVDDLVDISKMKKKRRKRNER